MKLQHPRMQAAFTAAFRRHFRGTLQCRYECAHKQSRQQSSLERLTLKLRPGSMFLSNRHNEVPQLPIKQQEKKHTHTHTHTRTCLKQERLRRDRFTSD